MTFWQMVLGIFGYIVVAFLSMLIGYMLGYWRGVSEDD